MPEQVWICKTCRALCDSEDLALECEKAHKDTTSLSIVSVEYASDRPHDGFYKRNRAVPNRVTIKFGDWPMERATYVLEHVGLKGI